MGLFNLIKKENKLNDFSKNHHITNLLCHNCGNFIPLNSIYCLYCGIKQPTRPKPTNETPPISSSDSPHFEDSITRYLIERGLFKFADKQFLVKVRLENGKKIKIPLLGKQQSFDAIEFLSDNGFLEDSKNYRFDNWPQAHPCIGPHYHHVSACVCELNLHTTYRLESFRLEDIRMLYGCPTANTIIKNNILDQVSVEVIDYEK